MAAETPTRTYSSGVSGRLGALALGLIAVPLLAIGIPLVVRDVFDYRDSRVLIGAVVVIAIVGGLGLLTTVLVTGPVRVETDATQVAFRKGLRVIHTWPRDATHFTSLVVRETTNGVRSGTQRTLIALREGERTELLCRWFTAQTFNDLMADLAPIGIVEAGVGQQGAEHEPSPPRAAQREGHAIVGALDPPLAQLARAGGATSSAQAFDLDHRRHPSPRSAWRWIAGAGVLVVAAALVAAVVVSPIESVDDALAVAAIVGVMVVGLPTAGLALGWAIRRRRERRRVDRMPRRITVTPSGLQIDQSMFHYSQLSSVVATPPGYETAAKRITLVASTGERSRFDLTPGGTADIRYRTLPRYAEFVEALGRTAPVGLVRFDLR